MKKVVLAGGSGNLGQVIARSFLDRNYEVVILSRSDRNADTPHLSYMKWSGKDLGEWTNALEGAQLLINMSGESINKRLTEVNKRLLEDSRIQPTHALGRAIATQHDPPPVWINFSGISLFGGLDGIHDEDSTDYAGDFLSDLTQKWEAAFNKYNLSRTKKILLRLSPVLQQDAGMFDELYPLVKLGLGGKVASGNQIISWIHETDLVRIVHWIINLEKPSDVYHACSPHPVSNANFMRTMRRVAGVRIGVPLPRPLAKLGAFLKGVDDSLLLQGNAVVSKRLSEEGFVFLYPTIQSALTNLVRRQ